MERSVRREMPLCQGSVSPMQPRNAGSLRDDITTWHRRFFPSYLPFEKQTIHPSVKVERKFSNPPSTLPIHDTVDISYHGIITCSHQAAPEPQHTRSELAMPGRATGGLVSRELAMAIQSTGQLTFSGELVTSSKTGCWTWKPMEARGSWKSSRTYTTG